MRGLLYGVRPDPEPDFDADDNALLRALARTPMRLATQDQSGAIKVAFDFRDEETATP